MILSDKKGIQQIVLTLSKLGLEEVVLCPGSRNAPLVISFNRHPDIHCTGIRDERSAAFFALGKAMELQKPVAVVCTSGSAALNFAPAVSEAYYQRIPLIVLTADRPKEWTDQGDGQTINQTDIYNNFIRKSYLLKGEASTKLDFWHNERCLSEGFNIAQISDRGPVHFNIPLQEPLYETATVKELQTRVFKIDHTEKKLPKETLNDLSSRFSKSKKVMFLVGQYPKDIQLQNELSELSDMKKVVVLTESTSNLHDPAFIENIDRCITKLNEEEARDLMPDLLITVGGAVVSKRIKRLLRKYQPKAHWNVHPFEAMMDTYQSLTHAIPLEPALFLQQISEFLPVDSSSNYRERWRQWNKIKGQLHSRFIQDCPHSDLRVFHHLFQAIPQDTCLHISNSSPIRYAQLFDNHKIFNTKCNRGTSGIDGCTSTVVGAAASSPETDFLLITGDVAFHYDSNALWNEEPLNNLKIIVLNNGGGNIFRIISGPNKVEEIKPYFETSMDANVKDIAAHYQWKYLAAKDESSLETALSHFFDKKNKKCILEIFTDAETNPKILKKYWEFLKIKTAKW